MLQGVRRTLLSSGNNWAAMGYGYIGTLRQLGTFLNAHPATIIVQLRDYDASADGIFAHSVVQSVYTGRFDGGRHVLSNFTVLDTSNTAGANDGLFENLGDNAGNGSIIGLTISGTITQTARERPDVSGGRYLLGCQVGGLVSVNKGKIIGCTTRMVISGAGSGGQFGGLVAKNEMWSGSDGAGQVLNCIFDSNVTITPDAYNTYQSSGVAYNLGKTDGCVAKASCYLFAPSGTSIYANMNCGTPPSPPGTGPCPTTGSWQGLIVGANGAASVGASPFAVVSNCVSLGNATNSGNVNSANFTGLIAGYNGDGTIKDCTSTGNALGASSVGGVAGTNALSSSVIIRSTSFGSITGTANNIGGIVGQDSGSTSESWSYGVVTGTTDIGGAIGLQHVGATASIVFACGNVFGTVGVGPAIGQALGTNDQILCLGVATGTSKVGGFGGVITAGTFTNCYWNMDSSGSTKAGGDVGTKTGVTGLSDAALLAGLPTNFGAKWSRDATKVVSSGYPYINTVAPYPAPIINLNPAATISLFATASSVDSTTIAMPAGIAAGDYAYMVDFAQNITTTSPALVTPVGFSNVAQQTSASTRGTRLASSIKILDGTETTITGMVAGLRATMKTLFIFRPSKGSTWTRLNAHVIVDGAAGGSAAQAMGAGTSPCIIVGAVFTEGGTLPTPQISSGDDVTVSVASAITPAVNGVASCKVNNTGAASSTYNGDTTHGNGLVCVNVSLSA